MTDSFHRSGLCARTAALTIGVLVVVFGFHTGIAGVQGDGAYYPPNAVATATMDTTLYVTVEESPEPVGGLEAIMERVRYPEAARLAGIEGFVEVQFLVQPDGSTTDHSCTRDIGWGSCASAIEAIRQTEFLPGRHRGHVVTVRMSIPIRFRLTPPAQDEP